MVVRICHHYDIIRRRSFVQSVVPGYVVSCRSEISKRGKRGQPESLSEIDLRGRGINDLRLI
jgi:hypothetical protein